MSYDGELLLFLPLMTVFQYLSFSTMTTSMMDNVVLLNIIVKVNLKNIIFDFCVLKTEITDPKPGVDRMDCFFLFFTFFTFTITVNATKEVCNAACGAISTIT